jgi:hypothetical protein
VNAVLNLGALPLPDCLFQNENKEIEEIMNNELTRPVKAFISIASVGELLVPVLVAVEGEHAATRYIEFFTAQIRNPNTRAVRHGSSSA